MGSKSAEDRLLDAACGKLHSLIRGPTNRSMLEAFAVEHGGAVHVVRLTLLSNRPVALFHLAVYDMDGVYETAAAVSESSLKPAADTARPVRKPSKAS